MNQKERNELKKAGRFIRSHRKTSALTLEKLAEYCNLSDDTLSNLERGLKVPKANTLLTVCRVLEINIGELADFYHIIDKEE